ncbi:kinase D-interacting substrate of 220 kDa B isoform X2 [Acyrthosiphon pisum]|uniref:KAP NTPase domain-containing protein n=1 Tax=Acyrthosiphon pisum TaxID=7029 RepID=A0A8R2B6P4_ACYPI|nr:kinase D-interacting substrate of 220 kDa B isoform X2 [Acyrthosiphon pisum]|eukprot:XP_008184045.1 PREDICTED: kinase D-interacting substrate of 220 kDa isoform X2 [Acyrthosiphon pisum]
MPRLQWTFKSNHSSVELLPLSLSYNVSRSYGSILSYFHFLKRINGDTQNLHTSDSMVSLCYRALHNYISENNLEGLQGFLENRRVLVDDRDDNGATALHYAAVKGKLQFLRELINHGSDVNIEDNDNWTALICAAKEGHTDICAELLDHGADIEHRDMGGWTSLIWSSYCGYTNLANLLLDRGADINAHGNFHITALVWAAGRGHTKLACSLIARGAKVNVGDKYGTSALVWACRKGDVELVDSLLRAGANVDTAGMYSWTPLLVSSMGNHTEVVNLLLERKPNVNALDQDGCTALTIACKEGYYDIANSLLNAGAYINIQDRSSDTNLIHAVKGGHRNIVEALLKKYADVDVMGKERKTALYIAIEKGNTAIIKLLLGANPDLEISTKDGDTPLMRAVRNRNAEAVQLLIEKRARVPATDKRGDTALHIAMRARARGIVEILLRNPKNSQLLYRPNRAGETPYNMDVNAQKPILSQIFGSRRLNTNEDNENLLGYDLYSSALADMLSEPTLSMPITVGLYAKWGSGKSFLLNKLREEMKNFAHQWTDPFFQFPWLILGVALHFCFIAGTVVVVLSASSLIAIITTFSLLTSIFFFLIMVYYGSHRLDWAYNCISYLSQKAVTARIILQIIFCHPPGSSWGTSVTAQPIRFYFTDQTRVSSTTPGESTIIQMIGSLYDSIEKDFGSISTRLYRAFRPKPVKLTSPWKWRKLCCMPNIILFEMSFLCVLLATLIIAINNGTSFMNDFSIDKAIGNVILFCCGMFILLLLIGNLYTFSQLLQSLVFSQRKQLRRATSRLDTLKSEGFIQALRTEVNLMTEMVRCLDAFTQQQTRLVIIIDGLDSCEQDKILLLLDAVRMLFSEQNTPFIIVLAIDPHAISQVIELNSRRLLSDMNFSGHDYLKNMVHLPFFLQNSGLRKVKLAQKSSQSHRKSVTNQMDECGLVHSASTRRLSNESTTLKPTMGSSGGLSRSKGNINSTRNKLKSSESIASSIASNIHRLGGPQDLSKILLTDDYFSDVNPRSMRRLMNIVYITGRLLKAFQLEFNWYHLASWINITEQWPYRISWMIIFHDTNEDTIDDSMSLKTLYEKVRRQIQLSKDIDPLMEMDKDEKKFEIFLSFHRTTLLVSDLRIFLPFTINLDPYLRKVIKDEMQNSEDSTIFRPTITHNELQTRRVQNQLMRRQKMGAKLSLQQETLPTTLMLNEPQSAVLWNQQVQNRWHTPYDELPNQLQNFSISSLSDEFNNIKLSSSSVDDICKLLARIRDLQESNIPKYTQIIKDNNLTGCVLLHCNLNELKNVLKMNFGDWELFRIVLLALRDKEYLINNETNSNINFKHTRSGSSKNLSHERRGSSNNSNNVQGTLNDKDQKGSKVSSVEKQVTLEEQMICGALQTLNEEACEDVMEESEEQGTIAAATYLQVPQQPIDIITGDGSVCSTTSSNDNGGDVDAFLLQNSPHHSIVQYPAFQYEGNNSVSANSLNNTPIASRKNLIDYKTCIVTTTTEKAGKPYLLKSIKRPASLVMNRLDDADIIPETKNSVQASGIVKQGIAGSVGMLSCLVASTSWVQQPPAVTISPVCSNEKLPTSPPQDTNHSSAVCATASSDDESTPLVSDMSSPQSDHLQSNTDRSDKVYTFNGMYYKENSQHSLTSQLSSKSTESLQLRSEGGGCSFDEDIDLLRGINSIQSGSRRVSFDSDNSILGHSYDWNDPETMV